MNYKSAEFRFYEELNDFLPKDKRKKSFQYYFTGTPAIKDAIEAIGIPHTEIDLILVNEVSVGFEYHLSDRDRVSVYPVFESLDIEPILKLRPKPLRNPKFITDVHLGKLTRLLRMLGFDTVSCENNSDSDIVNKSIKDSRIILTRDRNLLKIKSITHGHWLHAKEPMQQIIEVLKRFDLWSKIDPFSRCMKCNGLINSVNTEQIINKLPAKTIQYYNKFYKCSTCSQIYWGGSHYLKMQKKISNILKTKNMHQ